MLRASRLTTPMPRMRNSQSFVDPSGYGEAAFHAGMRGA